MSSQRLSARKAMKKEPADHDMEDADVDPPASKAKRGTKRPRKSSTAAPKKRGSAVKREEEDEDDDDDGEEEEETETTDHHWDDIRKGLMMDDQMHMPPLSPSMRGVIGPDDGMISDSALRDIKRESDDATRRLQDEVDRSYPNDDSGDDDDADESGPATKKRKGREKAETRDHKGLRHFSILVCEKLANLGTSTYKEIADQLVAEATISKSYVGYDEKNIRRRIYDALNVLMAMDIITKERKNIRWKGFEAAGGTGAVPGTAAAAANLQASPSGAGSKSASASRTAQSVAPLMASITAKKQTIASKKATLEELTLQYCGLRALLTRNKQLDAAAAPNSNTANAAGSSNANGNGTANPSSNSASPSPPVADKLPWPFLVLAAPPGIPVECTTDDTREMVILTFAEPFAVHEHTQVLQYLGQHYVQHAPTVDTIQAKAGANANGTTAATNATSDSPFEQLVSAAAASPKLKSVPTSNSRRANSAQANASAAAAAAAANSALVTTNATPTADPRFSVPPAIWNLLPENSTLKKGAEAFAASVASQTAAATTANADDAFKAQAYKTLTGGNGLVNGTGATPSASVSPPALNASTPAAAAAPTPASTSKFANPFTQQPQLTAPAASNAQTSIDTATATTQ